MTELRYRTTYVMAPRPVLTNWHHEPWDVVLSAAERGEDGLSVVHGRPKPWYRPNGDAPDDVAFMTNGQGGEWEKKTVLHQQNW